MALKILHSISLSSLSAIIALMLLVSVSTAQAQQYVCKGKTGCATPGTACADSTVFAGCPGPSYQPIYITRCDAGRTWNGSACGGTAATYAWNNGNATGRTNVAGLSQTDGIANTTALIAADADSGVGGTQPHLAAAHCDNLTFHGYSDWFLPSRTEIAVIRTHIGMTMDMSAVYYWASNQLSTNNGAQKSSGPTLFAATKETANNVRCARKD